MSVADRLICMLSRLFSKIQCIYFYYILCCARIHGSKDHKSVRLRFLQSYWNFAIFVEVLHLLKPLNSKSSLGRVEMNNQMGFTLVVFLMFPSNYSFFLNWLS